MLKVIAWEEAGRASVFADLNRMPQKDIFENIKRMLEGKIYSNKVKKEAADRLKSWASLPQEITSTFPPKMKQGMREY
nr:hypothetical protein [Clostridia bacterium]